MRMRSTLIATLALVIAWGMNGVSLAAIIASYDFDGGSNPDLNPDTVDADIAASVISAGPNNTFTSQAGYASQVLRTLQVTDATTEATAVSSGSYFEFSVTLTDSEKILNLTNLTFDTARGGAGSPRSWYLYSSSDGFTLGNAIDMADIPTVRPNLTSYLVDLSAAQFQELIGTTTFRLYSSVPSAGSSIEWDNFVLNGETALIPMPAPEPSTLMLLGFGVLGLLRQASRGSAECRLRGGESSQ